MPSGPVVASRADVDFVYRSTNRYFDLMRIIVTHSNIMEISMLESFYIDPNRQSHMLKLLVGDGRQTI